MSPSNTCKQPKGSELSHHVILICCVFQEPPYWTEDVLFSLDHRELTSCITIKTRQDERPVLATISHCCCCFRTLFLVSVLVCFLPWMWSMWTIILLYTLYFVHNAFSHKSLGRDYNSISSFTYISFNQIFTGAAYKSHHSHPFKGNYIKDRK